VNTHVIKAVQNPAQKLMATIKITISARNHHDSSLKGLKRFRKL